MDDIVFEVRKIREAYAKQFAYDLQAIHRDLKAQEKASGRRVVSLPPRRPKPVLPKTEPARTARNDLAETNVWAEGKKHVAAPDSGMSTEPSPPQ